MSRPQPYSLRPDSHTSDFYYADIAAFSNRWLAGVRLTTRELIEDFRARQARAGKRPRSVSELAYELLVIGVLLHEHGHHAAHLNGRTARLLKWLNEQQQQAPQYERIFKTLRGWVGGLNRLYRAAKGRVYATETDLERLIAWLDAQGETTQAERLREWLEYFQSQSSQTARRVLRQCWRMARAFERDSQPVLGRYTAGVDRYRISANQTAQWRYDESLLTRTRLEYHLGMLGTEILNRAYREKFRAADRRLVIVPPCLRAKPEELCQAVETPLGAQCTGCTPTCRVHQITKLAEKQGALVTCIPDDELTRLCLASGQAGGSLGVVGMACALRNWSAGWEADRLNLPAQGVLLDYSGCQKHWDEQGLSTDVNFKQLEALLSISQETETGVPTA